MDAKGDSPVTRAAPPTLSYRTPPALDRRAGPVNMTGWGVLKGTVLTAFYLAVIGLPAGFMLFSGFAFAAMGVARTVDEPWTTTAAVVLAGGILALVGGFGLVGLLVSLWRSWRDATW